MDAFLSSRYYSIKIICFVSAFFILQTCSAFPLLANNNSSFNNPFVGFYVFPHGGITLDPANMDYSTQPAFNKADSKVSAIKLHEAMKKAADSLIQSKPDLIIFSTPHGLSLAESPLILSTAKTYGDVGGIWSHFNASFDIERRLSGIMYGELKAANNAIEILTLGLGYSTAPIFWAEVIPWYFIREAAQNANIRVPPVIYIGQALRLDMDNLASVGRDIVKTVLIRSEFANKRIAVAVSGDLSHYHSKDPNSPYPYSPISSVFDDYIVNWAKLDRNTKTELESKNQILTNAGKIEQTAGTCGYSGLVMLHGMLEEVVHQNWSYKSNFYEYQVPSYFGMIVVGWTPEK